MELQDFYKDVLDNLYDGILISDKEGNVIYINEQYTNITGLTKDVILNKNLQDLMDKGIINKSVSLDVIETGKAYSLINKYYTGREAFTNAVPLKVNGEIVAAVNATRDLDVLLEMRDLAVGSNTGQMRLEVTSLHKLLNQHDDIIAMSPAMQETIADGQKAAPYDTTVLITGESGTGKEVVARYIHNNSHRKNQAFIRVNCAAIPSELFESELFGYEKGAFTGARDSGKIGMFELADKGTILLDEIGELPLEMQSKLLRVIQEQEVQRIGGSELIPIDVRILTSTNRNLLEAVKNGEFREDLYYRINVFPIRISPLREREEDIEPLINHFLGKLNKKYHTTVTLDRDALHALESYTFPGNVRELENIIEYLYVLSKDTIKVETIPGKILTKIMMSSGNKTFNEKRNLNDLMNLYEKTIIEDIIANYKTLEKASSILGIHPSTLSRKMKKYDLNF